MTGTGKLRTAALFAGLASAGMLGFAFYAQYVEGLLPCILCLYQRPPHYIAATAALGAAALSYILPGASRIMLALAALALLAGAGIAAYHAGVEWKLWEGPAACGGAAPPLATNAGDLIQGMRDAKIIQCNEASWIFLGLSMAAWNAILSIGLALVALAGAAAHPSRRRHG